jgi:hypothetical protein
VQQEPVFAAGRSFERVARGELGEACLGPRRVVDEQRRRIGSVGQRRVAHHHRDATAPQSGVGFVSRR